MKLRCGYSLRGFEPRRESDVPSTIELREDLVIRLYIDPDLGSEKFCIEGTETVEINEKLLKFFSGLAQGRLSSRFCSSVTLPIRSTSALIMNEDGVLTPGHAFPRSAVPDFAKEFINRRESSLSSEIRDYFSTLRWVQNASGPHSPFASLGLHFSVSPDEWHKIPTESKIYIHCATLVETTKESLVTAKELLDNGASEPVYHLLLREANELSGASPRSALLIALSALEIGVKELTFYLCPGSDIVLEDIQSPPLLKFLNEKLPRMLALKKPKIDQSRLPLSQPEKDLLLKWITQRNQVAHAGKRDVNYEELLDLLDLVKEILYTIDAIRGHDWALKNIGLKGQRTSIGFI